MIKISHIGYTKASPMLSLEAAYALFLLLLVIYFLVLLNLSYQNFSNNIILIIIEAKCVFQISLLLFFFLSSLQVKICVINFLKYFYLNNYILKYYIFQSYHIPNCTISVKQINCYIYIYKSLNSIFNSYILKLIYNLINFVLFFNFFYFFNE